MILEALNLIGWPACSEKLLVMQATLAVKIAPGSQSHHDPCQNFPLVNSGNNELVNNPSRASIENSSSSASIFYTPFWDLVLSLFPLLFRLPEPQLIGLLRITFKKLSKLRWSPSFKIRNMPKLQPEQIRIIIFKSDLLKLIFLTYTWITLIQPVISFVINVRIILTWLELLVQIKSHLRPLSWKKSVVPSMSNINFSISWPILSLSPNSNNSFKPTSKTLGPLQTIFRAK